MCISLSDQAPSFQATGLKKNKLIAIPCIYRRLQKKDTGTDGAEAYPDVNKGHFSEMRLPEKSV